MRNLEVIVDLPIEQMPPFVRYVEAAVREKGTPHAGIVHEVQTHPSYTLDLEEYLGRVDDFLAIDPSPHQNNPTNKLEPYRRYPKLWGKMTWGNSYGGFHSALLKQEILNYFDLVRDSEEQTIDSNDRALASTLSLYRGLKRDHLGLSGQLEITEDFIKATIREAQAKEFLHDFKTRAQTLSLDYTARQYGFENKRDLFKHLDEADRDSYKRFLVEKFKAEYRMDNTLSAADFCYRHGNISSDSFYKMAMELEGGVRKIKAKIEEEVEDERQRPIKMARQKKRRNRIAAAIGLFIGSIIPSPADTAYRGNSPQAPQMTEYSPHEVSKNYVTLAESNFSREESRAP